MDITEIIGRDKAFEPPFERKWMLGDGQGDIVDRKGRTLITRVSLMQMAKRQFGPVALNAADAITKHICELLNSYHCPAKVEIADLDVGEHGRPVKRDRTKPLKDSHIFD